MTTIRLYEEMKEETVAWLMPVLDSIPDSSKILFKIDIPGAVRSTRTSMLRWVDRLRYEQHCQLVAEGIKFYSAAFLLFILCDERIVNPESEGMMHLHELSDPELRGDLTTTKITAATKLGFKMMFI